MDPHVQVPHTTHLSTRGAPQSQGTKEKMYFERYLSQPNVCCNCVNMSLPLKQIFDFVDSSVTVNERVALSPESAINSRSSIFFFNSFFLHVVPILHIFTTMNESCKNHPFERNKTDILRITHYCFVYKKKTNLFRF